MVSISNIKGSNGSGQAVRGAVTNARAISSTTLKVDSVTNYPSQFIATTGKLGPSGILDNTTVQVFFGHLSGADIIIDSFAPGYTDKGNSVADVVILKPTTAWADEVAGVLGVAHNDNGTIKNNAVKTAMLDAANIDASVALKDASVTSQKIDFTTLNFGNYSTSEVNTGFKWIDGKTIYKKTYNFGALPNNTIKNLAHGLSISWLVKYEAISRRSNGNNEWVSLPLVYNSGTALYNTEIQVNVTDIAIYTTQDRTMFATTYVTLYYTKT